MSKHKDPSQAPQPSTSEEEVTSPLIGQASASASELCDEFRSGIEHSSLHSLLRIAYLRGYSAALADQCAIIDARNAALMKAQAGDKRDVSPLDAALNG